MKQKGIVKVLKFYKLNNEIVIGGKQGEELIPNTTEGAYEKHVPVIEHRPPEL